MPACAPPEPQRLPPPLPASCARPSGPEVTGKQLDRQLGAREAPAPPWGPEEREGRAEWLLDFGFLQLRLPSSHREPGARSRESSGSLRQPRHPPGVHGRPGPGRRRAERRARTLRCWRREPRAGPAPLHGELGRAPLAGPGRAQAGRAGRSLRGRGAPGSGLAPGPGSRGPLWPPAGGGEGSLYS